MYFNFLKSMSKLIHNVTTTNWRAGRIGGFVEDFKILHWIKLTLQKRHQLLMKKAYDGLQASINILSTDVSPNPRLYNSSQSTSKR